MKVGILGTGFGSYHLSLFKKIEGVEVVKIYGRNEERLKKLSEEHHIAYTQDINDIINDTEIDLIDICLPTNLHTRYIIEALKAGKHVYCETPLCYTLEDAATILEAETKYHKRVYVDLFVKFFPEYQYILKAIQENTYGSLKTLTITRKTPPIWGNLGLDTIIPNLMLHDLDLCVWFLGEPMNKKTFGISGQLGESHVKAILEYNDTLVEVEASSMMPNSYPFTISCEAIFEKGMLEYHASFTSEGIEKSFYEYTSDGKHELNLEGSDPYEQAIRHVIDCCKHDKPTVLGASAAARALAIAFELRDNMKIKVL